VYLWNFKGKQSDPEALSSSSLFEIEIASKIDPLGQPLDTQSFSKSALDSKKEEIKRQDFNERTGRVYTYSIKGGITSK